MKYCIYGIESFNSKIQRLTARCRSQSQGRATARIVEAKAKAKTKATKCCPRGVLEVEASPRGPHPCYLDLVHKPRVNLFLSTTEASSSCSDCYKTFADTLTKMIDYSKLVTIARTPCITAVQLVVDLLYDTFYKNPQQIHSQSINSYSYSELLYQSEQLQSLQQVVCTTHP